MNTSEMSRSTSRTLGELLKPFARTAPDLPWEVDRDHDPSQVREERRMKSLVDLCLKLKKQDIKNFEEELFGFLENLELELPEEDQRWVDDGNMSEWEEGRIDGFIECLLNSRGFSRSRSANDLMRSYLPVLLGALHESHLEKGSEERRAAGERLLKRLVPEEGSDGANLEEASVVRQWVIRILLRVYFEKNELDDDRREEAADSLNGRIVKGLQEFLKKEDVVLTQLVAVAEAGRLRDPSFSEIFRQKLADRWASIRIEAARGLQALGLKVQKPQESLERLCDRLHKLAASRELHGTPEDGHSVEKEPDADDRRAVTETRIAELMDWEFSQDKTLEPVSLIRAIAAVGRSSHVNDLSSALELLRAEALAAGCDDDPRVALAAVDALGTLGQGRGQKVETQEALIRVIMTSKRSVANSAAEALRKVTDASEASSASEGATDFLVKYALEKHPQPDMERIAQAIRVVDGLDDAAKRLQIELEGEGPARTRAHALLTALGGVGPFQTLLQYRRAQDRLTEIRENSERILHETLKEGFRAAEFTSAASKSVFLIGVSFLLVVAMLIGFRPVSDDIMKWLLGSGVAGIATLLTATYVSPVRRIAESVENLIRTQAMAMGFNHQITYAQLMLNRMFTGEEEEKLDEGLEPIMEQIRLAMKSVNEMLRQGESDT